MEDISINLKKLRKEMAMTQSQFAEAINVKRTTLASWESGASEPNPLLLKKIAEVFQIDIERLTIPNKDNSAAGDSVSNAKLNSELVELLKKEAEFKNTIIQQLLTKLNEK